MVYIDVLLDKSDNSNIKIDFWKIKIKMIHKACLVGKLTSKKLKKYEVWNALEYWKVMLSTEQRKLFDNINTDSEVML